MCYPESLFNERVVVLRRSVNSQEILLAVSMQVSSANIFHSGFASIYGSKSLNPLRIVALYFDMIRFSLGKVSAGVPENVVACLELRVAEEMVPSGFTIRIKELLVQVESLFGMPAVSFFSMAAV